MENPNNIICNECGKIMNKETVYNEYCSDNCFYENLKKKEKSLPLVYWDWT